MGTAGAEVLRWEGIWRMGTEREGEGNWSSVSERMSDEAGRLAGATCKPCLVSRRRALEHYLKQNGKHWRAWSRKVKWSVTVPITTGTKNSRGQNMSSGLGNMQAAASWQRRAWEGTLAAGRKKTYSGWASNSWGHGCLKLSLLSCRWLDSAHWVACVWLPETSTLEHEILYCRLVCFF